MPKRSKTPLDLNQPAAQIVEAATSPPGYSTSPTPRPRTKTPIAGTLDRLGGITGGKARMAQRTAKRRSQSATKTAKARGKASS